MSVLIANELANLRLVQSLAAEKEHRHALVAAIDQARFDHGLHALSGQTNAHAHQAMTIMQA
jgi:hypothetical protein